MALFEQVLKGKKKKKAWGPLSYVRVWLDELVSVILALVFSMLFVDNKKNTESGAACLTLLHMSGAGGWLRSHAALSSRTWGWLVWLNHTSKTTFIPRHSFWWRWERYGLSILSSGPLALNALCFPLSFLWSISFSVVISLQGGKVVAVLAEQAASCSCRRFKAEHVTLIQIHDHISFMALQLWVRCFFSHCHISLNVILHACTHPPIPHTCTCALTHVPRVFTQASIDTSKNNLHTQMWVFSAHTNTHRHTHTCSSQSSSLGELPSSHSEKWAEKKRCM